MTAQEHVRRHGSLWLLLALVCVVTVAGGLGSASLERTTVLGLVQLVFVVALYVFAGNSGVFSFGHMAFAAVGAYTGALLTIPEDTKAVLYDELPRGLDSANLPAPLAVLVGGLVAALFAAFLSLALMRLRPVSLTLASFAVLIIVYVVASNWEQVTGATSGMTGVPTTTDRWRALAVALAAVVVAYAYQRCRAGRRLRATREDEVAARGIGVDPRHERRVAWILSAFVAGVGGALYAQFVGSFTPDAFYLNVTFLVLAMLVIGGLTSLSGAVVGTIVLTSVSEVLRRLEDGFSLASLHVGERPGLRDLGLAAIMVAVLLLRPQGITGGRELRWPDRLRPGGGATAPTTGGAPAAPASQSGS